MPFSCSLFFFVEFPHSTFFLTPFSLPYNLPGMPLLASFPFQFLSLLRYRSLLVSLPLSPPSHVFSLFLAGGSLVLIVFSQGKSHRRAVQSYKPHMTLSLFPITVLQDSPCTESTLSRYTNVLTCNNTNTQTHTYCVRGLHHSSVFACV